MNTAPAKNRDFIVWWIYGVLVVGACIVAFDIFRLYHKIETSSAYLDHALAVIAIIFGLVAIHYERKLDARFEDQKRTLDKIFDEQLMKLVKNFEEQRVEIKQIVESVYTRYIGDWPFHLKETTALINHVGSGDELLIMLDSPGYGSLSAHKELLDYMAAVKRASSSGCVKMLFHSEGAARDDLRLQFVEEQKNPAARESTRSRYRALYPDKWIDIGPSYEDLLTSILYLEDFFCTELTDAARPAQACPTPARTDNKYCFYWLIRRGGTPKEMIFAYSRFSSPGSGCGFETRDTKLMGIFAEEFRSIWEHSAQHQVRAGEKLYPHAWDQVQSWKNAQSKGGISKAASGDT